MSAATDVLLVTDPELHKKIGLYAQWLDEAGKLCEPIQLKHSHARTLKQCGLTAWGSHPLSTAPAPQRITKRDISAAYLASTARPVL